MIDITKQLCNSKQEKHLNASLNRIRVKEKGRFYSWISVNQELVPAHKEAELIIQAYKFWTKRVKNWENIHSIDK